MSGDFPCPVSKVMKPVIRLGTSVCIIIRIINGFSRFCNTAGLLELGLIEVFTLLPFLTCNIIEGFNSVKKTFRFFLIGSLACGRLRTDICKRVRVLLALVRFVSYSAGYGICLSISFLRIRKRGGTIASAALIILLFPFAEKIRNFTEKSHYCPPLVHVVRVLLLVVARLIFISGKDISHRRRSSFSRILNCRCRHLIKCR